VPDLVQLNMMRRIQDELLRKTRGVTKGFQAAREDLSPAEKALLQRLSDEQGKLGGLMKTFLDKFEEAKKEHEKGGPRGE
jgi:hypothetical protein